MNAYKERLAEGVGANLPRQFYSYLGNFRLAPSRPLSIFLSGPLVNLKGLMYDALVGDYVK